MELAINTIMIMVVLLVLVIIVLLLVGHTGANLNDVGADQLNITATTTECQLLCYKCCSGQYEDCSATSPDAVREIRDCMCVDNDLINFNC